MCTTNIREFANWVEELELIDLLLTRLKYTWFKDNSCSRLDRMMVMGKWLQTYQDIKLWGLKRGISYHASLLLKHKKVDEGPFRSFDICGSLIQVFQILLKQNRGR